MHVVISGAGIGGLTAALCCIKQGFKVTLLEQASELREVGAGVQISSNGSVVLRELGLLKKAEAVGVKPISFRVLGLEDDDIISDMPLGPSAAERYGEYFYQFHRADLLDILASELPARVLRLGTRVESFGQDENSAWAILKTGEEVRGDVLIGADGIHSAIRPQLVGDGRTTFSGKLVWRALIPAEKIRDLNFKEQFYGWAGPDRMVWAYWVRPNALFNFGGVVPSHEVRREYRGKIRQTSKKCAAHYAVPIRASIGSSPLSIEHSLPAYMIATHFQNGHQVKSRCWVIQRTLCCLISRRERVNRWKMLSCSRFASRAMGHPPSRLLWRIMVEAPAPHDQGSIRGPRGSYFLDRKRPGSSPGAQRPNARSSPGRSASHNSLALAVRV